MSCCYLFFFLAAFLAFGLPDFFAGDGFDFLGRFLGGGDASGGGPRTIVFSLSSELAQQIFASVPQPDLTMRIAGVAASNVGNEF